MVLSINKEHFFIKIQNEAKVGKWIFQLSAGVVCLVAVPVMPTHAVKSLQSERSKKVHKTLHISSGHISAFECSQLASFKHRDVYESLQGNV